MNDALPPDENPMLKAYEAFSRETPLVTRYLLLSQLVTWTISFLVDLPRAVGNVPHFTIIKFELYRILLSPFVCPNLLSLVFAFVSFADNGRRMEFTMGSTAYSWLIITIAVLVNLAHLLVSFILFWVTDDQTWLFLPSVGIWILVFGLVSIECAQAPTASSRKLFFFTVPTKYYPLALLAFFSFLGGFQLPYLLSIGIGFAYQKGHLDFLKVDNSRFQKWEETGLANCVRREGWVSTNESGANGDWSENEESGGLSLFSRLFPPQQRQTQGERVNENRNMVGAPGDPRPGRTIHTGTNGDDTGGGPFFPPGGRQLGAASRRTIIDPRQARLEALERRAAAASNAEQV